ncbi:Tom7 domain containing protein [Trichuris trichiura]|uniref:Tom7 domain containing protein n=1 Tax=Trichuris trichiura TaxID=36087 RepID=A0A077ZQI8_TRITR|nr:Tom7 domain containing protein [Trichuris trichiura]
MVRSIATVIGTPPAVDCPREVQWGTIPFIIYLGLRKGSAPGQPPITLMNCLWQ